MKCLTVPCQSFRVGSSFRKSNVEKSGKTRLALVCVASPRFDQNSSACRHNRRQALLLPLLTIGLSVLPKSALAEGEDAGAPVQPVAAPAAEPSQAVAPVSEGSETSLVEGTQPPPSATGENGEGAGAGQTSKVPMRTEDLTEEAAKKLLEEEEERRKARRRGKGRIRELEEIRAELAEKELVLLEKQQELLAQEQTNMVLREELEIERKIRTLLTKEKEKAEEEAALALGLCGIQSMLP